MSWKPLSAPSWPFLRRSCPACRSWSWAPIVRSRNSSVRPSSCQRYQKPQLFFPRFHSNCFFSGSCLWHPRTSWAAASARGFPLGPCSLLFYEWPYIVSATFCFSVHSFLDFNLCAAGTVGHFLASHWVCNSQFGDFLFGGTAWLAWMSAGFMKVWSRISLGFRPMPSSVLPFENHLCHSQSCYLAHH